MSINRPKISALIANQVPEFIRDDYQTFIAFLEAYYEYLEAYVDVDLKTVRDIDTTLDSFLKYFKNEVATNIPYTVVNERFLLSHMKDQYLAKGSEASFKLLFRLLFNKDINLSYPSRQMLRVSDGRWKQDVSLFARVKTGTPESIVGKLVDIITPFKTIKLLIDRYQTVDVNIDNVIQISDDVYEFFIDRKFLGDISINDFMKYSTIFDSVCVETTSKLKIIQGGRGFKLGQLYTINSGNGYGSIIKVSAVDSLGSITSAQFIKYGVGYDTNFLTTFLSTDNQGTLNPAIINVSGLNIDISESTNGFDEYGTINRVDYNVDAPGIPGAWDGTYSGEILREFVTNSGDVITDPLNPAILDITLGTIAKYPGYYTTNDGFLDDAIFIQDSKYYQAFSYVIKIDERFEDYKSAVKTLIHPSGMALFGEYEIRNEFDLSVTVESILKILNRVLRDSFDVSDSIFVDFSKVLSDSFSSTDSYNIDFSKVINELDDYAVLSDDIPIIDFGKVLSDSFTLSDAAPIIDFGKVLSDTVTEDDSIILFDFGKVLSDSFTLSDSPTIDFAKVLSDSFTLSDAAPIIDFGKVLSDSFTLSDSPTIDFAKVLSDSFTLSDAAPVIDFDKVLSDSFTLSDVPAIDFAKYIDELDDYVTETDNGGYMILNPYAEAGYVEVPYIDTPINF